MTKRRKDRPTGLPAFVGQQNYGKLKVECLKRKQLFVDLAFPPENSSLFLDSERSSDIVWKRPGELVSDPKLFVEGASPNDVTQGILGNCWFVSACSALTHNEELLEKVIPDSEIQEWDSKNSYCGIFRFRFWRFGEWIEVVIDDLLPTKDGKLLFARSKTPNEFWSALLEKAFAKLYGCYENLVGGQLSDALQDVSGGVAETINVKKFLSDDPKDKDERLFRAIRGAFDQHALIVAAIAAKNKEEIEKSLRCGLVKGHAYAVTMVRYIELDAKKRSTFSNLFGKNDDKLPMIRLQNPWGEKEWNGPWSDNDVRWEQVTQAQKQELGITVDEDGEFWMPWEEFVKYFTDISVCQLFNTGCSTASGVFHEYIFFDEWSTNGVKSGAPMDRSGGCQNFAATFCFNPQYRFDIKDPDTEIMIALTQKEVQSESTKQREPYVTIGIHVMKVETNRRYRIHQAMNPIGTSDYASARSVYLHLKDIQPGRYILMPTTYAPREQAEYMLRIYSPNESDPQLLIHDAPQSRFFGCTKSVCVTRLKILEATFHNPPKDFNLFCTIISDGERVRTTSQRPSQTVQWNEPFVFHRNALRQQYSIQIWQEGRKKARALGKCVLTGLIDNDTRTSVLDVQTSDSSGKTSGNLAKTRLGTLRIEDDLRFLYSPEDSFSRFEFQIHQNFSEDTTNSSLIAVALEAADGDSNMLRKEIAEAISDLDRFIQKNMTIEIDGKVYNFGEDVCSKLILCPISNTPVEIFFDVYFSEKLKQDPRVKLEWPVMKFFENRFFLPTNLYGVELDEEKANLKRIDMIHLVYHIADVDEFSSEKVSEAVEKSLRETLEERKDILKPAMFSLNILKEEMQKNTTYTFPYISLTIFLLISFTIGSSMTGDWITSKPIEALMGVFCSSLAIVSSAGILFAFGVPYISQVTVMPFLALAIGVDDTYVMLGAWQDTKRNLSPEKRIALALEEAGSAISVTSLTSVLSFGIGTFSTTPAISIFCKFIAIAIAFDWFYQVTLFAGVMALGGKREAAGYHCIFVWRKLSKEKIALSKETIFISPTRDFFANKISPILCKPFTRIFFIGIYAVYIFFAFYGCSLLKPNLTPSRLLVDDSPLTYYLKLAENKIWSEGVVGRVYINNAPDFSTNPELMDPMLQLISDLESTKYSMGPNSTSLWLRDFNNYRQYFAEDDEHFYETLKAFLGISFNKQWNSFIKWDENPNRAGKKYVDKFYFTTAFKIPDWNARTALLLEWRNITKSYPQFQALVFDENNFFSDQMLELKSTTLSSLGTAIITMIIICILFIADSAIVFWVTFILVSMDIGVAGYLSLWGSDLEPTTVVNILMSIGQCIDFATHVGYRIYRSPFRDPDERIADALGAIGWPVVQGGFSTFLAIIVMILVPSNVVRMFAKTSILVVATGLFHGIFILPIIVRSFASDITVAPIKDKGHKTS